MAAAGRLSLSIQVTLAGSPCVVLIMEIILMGFLFNGQFYANGFVCANNDKSGERDGSAATYHYNMYN